MTGTYRIHCKWIPGHPGFIALAVEVTTPGKPGWQIVDLISLQTWISRPNARQDMRSLLQELENAGYRPLGHRPFREAA